MADPSYWERMDIEGRAVLAALAVTFAVIVVGACLVFIFVCIKQWWQSPRMRLFRLGGVTTLRRNLNRPCTLCQNNMEAGEKVRTLSCDHVFHCGGSVKCEGVDQWLSNIPMTPWHCPSCPQVLHPVLPWKRTPTPSPAPSQEASAAAQQQLPRTSSTRDSEETLLIPEHDQTQPEASSSASAPPLGQLPLPVDDEIVQEAPSSQSTRVIKLG